MIDLTNAVVVSCAGHRGPEARAVEMLVDEVEKRTRIRWRVVNAIPAAPRAYILVGPASSVREKVPIDADPKWNAAEGYLIRADASAAQPQVVVAGADSRGVLYGVGRLLRNLQMDRDHIAVPADLLIASKPFHPLRGHQFGYRPKTNSYDGWSLPMWEQYVRDLIIFGANAVELIPPRSDDAADSPLFPLPPMQMMVAMSRLLDSYGMDVWVWYPAMDPDYSKPETVTAALKEWGEVFRLLPRIDAVFVPGGDPGHTEPKVLMALLEKQAVSLHRYHPMAQIWVSPQGFTQDWMDQFIDIVRSRPKWLGGIVFGPQVRTPLPELRKLIPAEYPIRHYPDITHSIQCQFPVDNWDVTFALTEGRECINPRPLAHARICRYHQPFTIGSISYSEGCNDDVNKALWSALEWDPDTDVGEILQEYSRCFIGEKFANSFAHGLLALEKNWDGPLDENREVEWTLRLFMEMERTSTPQNRLNWRFQQALYRAYYDAYVYHRLRYENEAEFRVLIALHEADLVARRYKSWRESPFKAEPEPSGWKEAIQKVEAALTHFGPMSDYEALRTRIQVLAEALFQSIRMQLSVPLYFAISVDRGANLDNLDHPLSNREWLTRRIAALPHETLNRPASAVPHLSTIIEEIHKTIHWTDPGPGGFYDDLGDPRRRPHLVICAGSDVDPGHMNSARMGYEDIIVGRVQWVRWAETLYDTPLYMAYSGLDPAAEYRLRVVYGPENPQFKIRLTAGEDVEIHPWMTKPSGPVEFDIPRAATEKGRLDLAWRREPGKGGNGRGCQVCEVWLMRR